MSSPQLFGFISVACSVIGYGIYIRSIIAGRTRPHLFSWLVWTVVLGVVFLAQLANGAGAGSWASGSSMVACFVIALFALWRGEKNITKGDWAALSGAFATIPIWYLTHDPLSVVILAVVIDALAYYPTYRKSYMKPYEENPYLYTMDVVKWLVAFLAMGTYSLAVVLYPLFLIFANGILVAMIIWRRKRLNHHPHAL